MSEGRLVGIAAQSASWCMGSFINWLKSGRLNLAIRGIMGAVRTVPETVPLDVTTGIEPEPTRGWLPAPAVGPDMVTISGEGGSHSDEQSGELVEESVWGLGGQ